MVIGLIQKLKHPAMKTKLLTALTLVNLAILLIVVFLISSSSKSDVVPTVVKARAFELVDAQGKIRAEIKVLPAEPNATMPDKGYPETVILRLIDSQGGPNVKLAATEDGSGMVLGGDSGYVQVLSRNKNPFVKINQKDGKEKLFKVE
jgi:hypothetical protein